MEPVASPPLFLEKKKKNKKTVFDVNETLLDLAALDLEDELADRLLA